jgi:hypothetical protein
VASAVIYFLMVKRPITQADLQAAGAGLLEAINERRLAGCELTRRQPDLIVEMRFRSGSG